MDPQSVINNQCSDYDIFIGLIGTRFGTKTPRHGSGTAEEYSDAVKKYKLDNKRVAVLFYRCNALVSPFSIDPEQLKNVNDFVNEIRKNGQIVRDYCTRDELCAHIRFALPEVARRLHSPVTVNPAIWQQHPAEESKPAALSTVSADHPCEEITSMETEIEDELPGLLDLLVDVNDSFNNAVSITTKIGDMTNSLADEINDNLSQMNSLRSGITSIDLKRSQRFVDMVAAQLDAYAVNLREETSMLSESVEFGVNTMIVVFSRSAEARIPLGTHKQRDEAVASLTSTVQSFSPAIEAMKGFQTALDHVPSLTSRFNLARRKTKNSLSYLISELVRQRQMIQLCIDATAAGVTIEEVSEDGNSTVGEVGSN